MAIASPARHVLLLFALVSACKKPAPEPERASPASGPERGDRVVVESSAAEFFEGRVLEIEPGRLRVERSRGGDSRWVERDDAYSLKAAETKPPPGAGALAICRSEPQRWLGCRVQRVELPRIVALDDGGRELSLKRDAVLIPNAVTELNIRHRFEQADLRKDFLLAFRRSGGPVLPAHWMPMPHARVLVRKDAGWYSGEIFEFDEETPRVRMSSDGRVIEVSVHELAPEPPYDTRQLKRGDFILLRPTQATDPWAPAQIRALGDQEFRVADADGNVKRAIPRDVVPLEMPDAG